MDSYGEHETVRLRQPTASMWRVRWVAAAYVLLQFVLYEPPPGVDPPVPLLPTGFVFAGLIVAVNIASAIVNRRGLTASHLGRRWMDVVELGLDTAMVLGVVWLFTFDGGSALWALLTIPVLEGALRWQLRGALVTWAAVAVGYVARDLWAASAFPARTFQLASVSYRMGIVLLVALTAGYLARNLFSQTTAHEQARRVAERHAAQLRTVATSARTITNPEVDVALSAIADSAVALGFDSAVVGLLDEAQALDRVAAWRGTRAGEVGAWVERLAAAMGDRRTSVVLDPGHAHRVEVVCPVLAGNDRVAVLGAGTHRQEVVSSDVECLELLAAQAGATLNHARRSADQARYEARLHHLAYHDYLTELPNRASFMTELESALQRSRHDGQLMALLFCDLDGFKTVNDSLGYEGGDELIVAVAERLQDAVGMDGTVTRFGGDEFTVLLKNLARQEDAVMMAERMQAALRKSFDVRGREVFVSASVGIAFGPQGRAGSGELLRDADLAMYRTKKQGRGGLAVFTPDLTVGAVRRLELETDLRRALQGSQLELQYQPIISVTHRTLTAVEALIRWRHPRHGLIQPDQFITIAEETGLVVPLGRWVLEQACLQAERWRRDHGAAGLSVGVNLSARQLQDPGLVDHLSWVLRETGFPPQLLILEITESVMMQDPDTTMEQISAIDRYGVRLAVDDFGQGYSSLSRLRGVPIGLLKIDKSFVGGIATNRKDRAIVHSVITLAHDLQIPVTAEGIETSEQLQELRRLRCDNAQGFYICEPLDAEAVSLLLASYKTVGRSQREPVPIARVLTTPLGGPGT